MTARTVVEAAAEVVASGRCTGCGLCSTLEPALTMATSPSGYLRPRASGPGAADATALRTFRAACPGVTVTAQRPTGSTYHPLLGPVLGCWEAWATDPEVRHRGSSGGALTALSSWLLATGEATAAVGAAADARDPRRTVPVRIVSRDEALAAAGSRYGPVGVAGRPEAGTPGTVTTGKPCEVAALRAASGADDPLLLSFFCAGTPSQHATDRLVADLGMPATEEVAELWYRGRGWPGRFTARGASGTEVSTTYDESWGRSLGPTVQWRCKICPDGVGESADVAAGDFWRTDERGYPLFEETAGASALLARTPRGLDLVRRAAAAGVIGLREISPDEVAAVQPLQRTRRSTLAGRLAGARLAGARLPRFRGFGLARLAMTRARTSWRTARGTFRRVRDGATARS